MKYIYIVESVLEDREIKKRERHEDLRNTNMFERGGEEVKRKTGW